MSSSRIPALIDALIDLVRAQTSLTVYDSRPLGQEYDADSIVVGADTAPDAELSTAATADQAWVTLGAMAREETGSVHCVAVSWTGDFDDATIRGLRARVFGNVAQVEAAVRADPTLGQTVRWAGVSVTRFDQMANDQGSEAHVAFQVDFTARI